MAWVKCTPPALANHLRTSCTHHHSTICHTVPRQQWLATVECTPLHKTTDPSWNHHTLPTPSGPRRPSRSRCLKCRRTLTLHTLTWDLLPFSPTTRPFSHSIPAPLDHQDHTRHLHQWATVLRPASLQRLRPPRYRGRFPLHRQTYERMASQTRTAHGVVRTQDAHQEQSSPGGVISASTTSDTPSRSSADTATARNLKEEDSQARRILRDTRQNTTRASCATGMGVTEFSAAWTIW